MNNPIVSVFSLVYNTQAEFSIQAIDSIHSQTYKNIEHFVINDAPDDKEHWPMIKEHIITKGYPTIIIEHEKNQGITSNQNEILTIAKGKFMCGCSDDYWDPDFLEKQIAFFEEQEDNVACVFSDVTSINENNEIINKIINQNYKSEINNLSNENIILNLLKQNFITAPSSIWRISTVKKINGYLNELYAEDFQLWFRLLLANYNIKYLAINKTKYRERLGAVSNTYETSGKMALDRCRLFHQTKSITPIKIWQEIEPIYYKFAKKVIGHPNLPHNVKEEIAQHAIKDLSYNTTYLLRLISLLHLYKLPFINNKIR